MSRTRSTPLPAVARAWRPLREFLRTESASGVVLVAATFAALVWANSPWRSSYASLWSKELSVSIGDHALALDLRHWVADGLMALFFLVVGLEITRELTSGHLADRRAATLPIAAAVGGMAVPAGIYLAIAGRVEPRGWGVPMATDIALAIGVLAISGPRVPSSGRAFLLGLAIVDDIGAIIVIAVAYTSGIEVPWLVAAAALLAAVVGLRRRVRHPLPFVVIGLAVWLAFHESGVHATLAGVAMGVLAPVRGGAGRSPVPIGERLVHVLHPWTSYAILPAFALASAGIEISSTSVREAMSSWVAWGVAVGLVAGKPIGVLVAARMSSRAGIATLPTATSTRHLVGIGHAAGIGFTVALFIADLAFDDPDQRQSVKLAILVASVISAVAATMVLRRARPAHADRVD